MKPHYELRHHCKKYRCSFHLDWVGKNMEIWLILPVLLGILVLPVHAQSSGEAVVTVAAVLEDFHKAASEADGARYFGHFTENAIFLGTDATERWTVDEFRAYARPHFDAGRGWTYVATERNVFLAEDGQTAWFDERLANEGLGECRGSGVLVLEEGRWKIAQYNLTIPIPNDLAQEVVEKIRSLKPD